MIPNAQGFKGTLWFMCAVCLGVGMRVPRLASGAGGGVHPTPAKLLDWSAMTPKNAASRFRAYVRYSRSYTMLPHKVPVLYLYHATTTICHIMTMAQFDRFAGCESSRRKLRGSLKSNLEIL